MFHGNSWLEQKIDWTHWNVAFLMLLPSNDISYTQSRQQLFSLLISLHKVIPDPNYACIVLSASLEHSYVVHWASWYWTFNPDKLVLSNSQCKFIFHTTAIGFVIMIFECRLSQRSWGLKLHPSTDMMWTSLSSQLSNMIFSGFRDSGLFYLINQNLWIHLPVTVHDMFR